MIENDAKDGIEIRSWMLRMNVINETSLEFDINFIHNDFYIRCK